MRIVCTICTDRITEDFAAAPCGHTFHSTCLSQWLLHQKTCPQCRERCTLKNVIKLFVDGNDPLTQTESANLDPQEMKEKLALQENIMKHKDKALSEARDALKKIGEEMEAWQAQYEVTFKKLKSKESTNHSLKEQLQMMRHECDRARKTEKEAEEIRKKMKLMEGVKSVLSGSRDEVEDLLKSYTSSDKLATYAIALKRDYEALKDKKSSLQRERDHLVQENNSVKKQLRSKENQLQSCQSKLSLTESDLHVSEQERENLHKKVVALEKAVESPGSRECLRRILESPLPEGVKRGQNVGLPFSDLGASPLLTSTKRPDPVSSDNTENQRESRPKPVVGTKRGSDSEPVLLPVKKMSKPGQTSKLFASGFNGMGGQSHFVPPKLAPRKPSLHNQRPLKFAPRKNSHPLKNHQLHFH